MTVVDFVKTNTQILSSCHLDFKLFNINRSDLCVFDSKRGTFDEFLYHCDTEIDHWFYYSNGTEKAFWIYIDGDND